jgi:hypothetical protein
VISVPCSKGSVRMAKRHVVISTSCTKGSVRMTKRGFL